MSAWLTVRNYLLTNLATLDGLSADTVFRGPAVTEKSPPKFVSVGVRPPDGSSGFFEQGSDFDGSLVAEQGEVNCWFVAQTGGTDLATLEAQVFAWTDALTDMLRADQRLGGALMASSTVRVGRVEPIQRQTKAGAVAEAVVAVSYTTRL